MKKSFACALAGLVFCLGGYAVGHTSGPVARAYRHATAHDCSRGAALLWERVHHDFQRCIQLGDIGPNGGYTRYPHLWRSIAGPLRARTSEAVWQVCRNIRLAKRLTVARYFRNVRKACNA